MKSKARKWGIILWCDNQVHINALKYIKNNYDNYIYILHDQDTKEDGSLKKAHYHVLLYFPNQKMLSTLKKQLCLNDSDFYEIKSFNGQLRYLIHYDDEDKFQYEKSNVHGSLYMLTKFKQAFSPVTSELEQVSSIIEYIDSGLCFSYTDLVNFVLDNDLYAAFRRNSYMFKELYMENIGRRNARKK